MKQPDSVKSNHPTLPSDRKIKAVHLLHTIAYGGIEAILINWAKRTRWDLTCNVDLSLVCFSNPDRSEQAFITAARKENIAVQTIPWTRRKPIFSSGKKLARILRAEHADVLHTHNTYADLTGWVAARRAGVKIVSAQYVWSDFGWKRNLLQWINQWALRSFDCVTAQCRATLQDTCARGVDPLRVHILPSGYEPDRTTLTSSERLHQRGLFGANETDVVLVNVARLYPEKAQARLLEVFRQVANVHSHARLWILGVGPLENDLRSRARALNLNNHVRFLGFRDDLQAVLRLADIQVHPSSAEGIPMAILSGMAAALPIVASEVGGIPEVLQQDITGILVPSVNHAGFESAFAGAMLKLIGDPEKRGAMGARAARFIEGEYSMEAAIRKLEQLYTGLLAR